MRYCKAILVILVAVFFPGNVLAEPVAGNLALNPLSRSEADSPYAPVVSRQNSEQSDFEDALNRAVAHKDAAEYTQAAKIMENIPEKFQNRKMFLSLLGRVYFLDAKIDLAASIFKKILSADRFDREANLGLALCYQENGRLPEAIKYFQKTVALDRANVIARLALGRIYSEAGSVPDALREFEEIKRIDPSIESSYEHLAALYLKDGNLPESYKAYQRIGRFHPEDKSIRGKISEIELHLDPDRGKKENKGVVAAEDRSVVVRAAAVGTASGLVRIGLMEGAKSLQFKCASVFILKKLNGQILAEHRLAGESYIVTTKGEGEITVTHQADRVLSVDTARESILICPSGPDGVTTLFNVGFGQQAFWASQENRSYRGVLEITAARAGLSAVNILSFEEYLYGVVPSEMPPGWPFEALKAQAIAARTEATFKMRRHQKEGFDLCATTHCQVYAGVGHETDATNAAVDATRGVLMTYQGKPIDAVYCSSCGGHTQNNIFGGRENIPYLAGRPDLDPEGKWTFPLSPLEFETWIKQPPKTILCNLPQTSTPSSFRWIRVYSAAEMLAMTRKTHDIGELLQITVTRREDSGHVSEIKITGSRDSLVMSGELNIRRLFGNLRSSLFKLETQFNSDGNIAQFIFYGGGWGHGVGLCQTGAAAMALKGKTSEEILKHYYRDIDLRA